MTQTTAAKPASKAVEFLRDVSPQVPDCAIVLGSGVKVLEDLEDSKTVSYKDVFGIAPGIVGHAGSLTIGRVGERVVAVLRGRFHLYEGYDWDVVTLPARAIAEWGVPKLYLTNAAGGLNKNFKVGDLMVLNGYWDFLNQNLRKEGLLPAIRAGVTKCANDESQHILKVAEELVKKDSSFRPLQAGVYAALLGPSYETLSEIEMLRRLKADAVGMSTVPEMQTVAGTKTKAAAISVVTNVWSDDEIMGGHEEVLEAAKEASERLDKLFRAAIGDIR
jgi:purine-nucleoside phosphorylase